MASPPPQRYAMARDLAEDLEKYQDALGIKTHRSYMDRLNRKIADLETEEGTPQ